MHFSTCSRPKEASSFQINLHIIFHETTWCASCESGWPWDCGPVRHLETDRIPLNQLATNNLQTKARNLRSLFHSSVTGFTGPALNSHTQNPKPSALHSHMSVSQRRYHSEVLSRGQTRSRSHGSCPDPFARARGVPAAGWGSALPPWTLRRSCWRPLFLRWMEGREEGVYGGEEPPSPCSERKYMSACEKNVHHQAGPEKQKHKN